MATDSTSRGRVRPLDRGRTVAQPMACPRLRTLTGGAVRGASTTQVLPGPAAAPCRRVVRSVVPDVSVGARPGAVDPLARCGRPRPLPVPDRVGELGRIAVHVGVRRVRHDLALLHDHVGRGDRLPVGRELRARRRCSGRTCAASASQRNCDRRCRRGSSRAPRCARSCRCRPAARRAGAERPADGLRLGALRLLGDLGQVEREVDVAVIVGTRAPGVERRAGVVDPAGDAGAVHAAAASRRRRRSTASVILPYCSSRSGSLGRVLRT